MSYFYNAAPPENIARVLEKFRRDIKNNQFNISTHANHRMVSRGISQDEMMTVVREGVLAKGKVIQDYIGGRFVRADLTVVVYAPYGDHNARPNIVTVYRDGDEDEYTVEDLPSVQQVTELQRKVVDLTARAQMAVADMSIDELEKLVIQRKAEEAEKQRDHQRRRKDELWARRDDVQAKLGKLQAELEDIDAELIDL